MTVTDLKHAFLRQAEESGLPAEGVNRALLEAQVEWSRRAHQHGRKQPTTKGNEAK